MPPDARWALLAGFLTALPVSADSASPAFSHAAWSAVLERFVDAEGRVDYEGLSRDRAQLDSYLESLARVSPEAHPELFPSRDEALAYYLNAYNAHVIAGVLARWPHLDSVWRNSIAAFNFFVRMKINLGGEKLHLKGLEDKRVRGRFQDPRVHAILNCASVSCPRLRRRAVEAATLDETLDAAMAELASHPKHFRRDDRRRTVHLSKIFDWFSSDFPPGLIDYVNSFRGPDDQVPHGYKVRFLRFDKGLNKQ